jgi:protein O-GlcNAc transferase
MDFYELSLKQRDPLAYRQQQFKLIISNLRIFSTSAEFDNRTVPLGYLIEYTKDDIVLWLSSFIKPEKRSKLLLLDWHEVHWCKELINELFTLRSHDLVYWLFVHVPYFTVQKQDIGEWRAHYVEMLDVLYDIWPKELFFTEKEFLFMSRSACATYALAYQNCINRNVLRKVCKLIRHIFPEINYTSPNIKTFDPRNKCRICFISNCLTNDTSVLKDRMGVILGLDRTKFDVYYSATIPASAIITPMATDLFKLIGGADKYIELDENSLPESRKRLDEFGFDIIVYPEIGMRVFTTLLAYSRIAPIQVNTWGHSDTSGIDTIDYYFTSKYFECNSAENYSEAAIELNSLSTYYMNPATAYIAGNFKTRSELGFTDNDNIYMCLQSSFKISAIFEKCIIDIINRDPHAYILLSINIPYPRNTINRIMENISEKNKNRIVLYPGLDKKIFINLTKISNVMLDSFPFGGCNSSLEAFSFGVPVITCPTNFINGRFTYGFYKYMGMDKCVCIVDSMDKYVDTALMVVNDKKLRSTISGDILANKDKLFNDKESIIEWNDKLLNLVCNKNKK